MLSRHLTAVVGIIFYTHLINAIPATALVSPDSHPVLYSWSTDPVCTTTAKKADCATAYAEICAHATFTQSTNVTVGDCTALYWYDAGNNIPTAAECTATYEQILATSIGGALGYNNAKHRTNDPLYAVYPADGNANCFKAPGDTSPVLAPNEMPGGGMLSTCPVSTSRRRRALDALERRGDAENGDDDGIVRCMIEEGIWGVECNLVCMATVTASSWM